MNLPVRGTTDATSYSGIMSGMYNIVTYKGLRESPIDV